MFIGLVHSITLSKVISSFILLPNSATLFISIAFTNPIPFILVSSFIDISFRFVIFFTLLSISNDNSFTE